MKMTPLVLKPVEMEVVSKQQAQASALANELERRARENSGLSCLYPF